MTAIDATKRAPIIGSSSTVKRLAPNHRSPFILHVHHVHESKEQTNAKSSRFSPLLDTAEGRTSGFHHVMPIQIIRKKNTTCVLHSQYSRFHSGLRKGRCVRYETARLRIAITAMMKIGGIRSESKDQRINPIAASKLFIPGAATMIECQPQRIVDDNSRYHMLSQIEMHHSLIAR